jgi:small conductance mechanosensitive channel
MHVTDIASLVEKLVEKLATWLQDFVVMLPNLVLAAAIVAVSIVASRWALTLVERMLKRLTGNEPVSKLLAALSRIALLAVASLGALDLLHLDKTVTSVLAGVGVLGLALGFAFQDIAANFMSGFIMTLYRPFEVSDMVEIADKKCKIVRVALRATEVETLDGLTILVPNKAIFQNPIINYTRTRCRRMDLSMGASYGDDMEKVRSTVLAAVRDVPKRDPGREPEVFFDSFGESSINFQLRIWLLESTQPVYMAARSEAMIAIKKAFDREGITIPFPIRTLDFGAGGVGGERLDAMKLEWGGLGLKERSG